MSEAACKIGRNRSANVGSALSCRVKEFDRDDFTRPEMLGSQRLPQRAAGERQVKAVRANELSDGARHELVSNT